MKHNKTFKRIISTVLCVCFLVGTFVVPSFAAKVSYSGSSQYMSSSYGKALVNCEITGNQKADVLNLAKSQLGYTEGWLAGVGNMDDKIDNLTEYNRWYYGYDKPAPWCAIWVSFIFRYAGISTDVIPNFSGCSEAVSKLSTGKWGKDHGTWHDAYLNGKTNYTPQAGDIVFFSWETDFVPYRYYVKDSNGKNIGQVNHVGIVYEDAVASSSSVKCIEGNSSDKVSIVSQNPHKIVGYFSPDYTNNAEENKLGTVDIVEPINYENAWILPNSPGLIDWNGYENASYYEYTIREQKYNHETGGYDVINSWLCQNVETINTFVDLVHYDLKECAAYKVWVGAFNANGEIIAENFIYLRIMDSEINSETGNRTEFDESFGGSIGGITDMIPEDDTPNTSGEGYDDPLPNGGYQVETDNGLLSKPSPSEGTEIPSGENSHENGSSNESAESTEDETISLLKRIIAMLEILFKFFGLAF